MLSSQKPIAGSFQSLDIRRLIALVRDQRLPQLQSLLASFPSLLNTHRAARPDGILQAGNGLLVGGPHQSLRPSLLPIVERSLGEARRLSVPCLHLECSIAAAL